MSGVAGVSNGDGDGSESRQPSLSTGSYDTDAKFSRKKKNYKNFFSLSSFPKRVQHKIIHVTLASY